MAHAEPTGVAAPATIHWRALRDDTTVARRSVSGARPTARFGVLPNFFCSADAAPGLTEELWKFAKSAYLDSPLPSLFKERLFVHLSRFCEVRYCIVRHVGFLIGQGRPAGDSDAGTETIDDGSSSSSVHCPTGRRSRRSLIASSVSPLPVGCRSLARSPRPISSTR